MLKYLLVMFSASCVFGPLMGLIITLGLWAFVGFIKRECGGNKTDGGN